MSAQQQDHPPPRGPGRDEEALSDELLAKGQIGLDATLPPTPLKQLLAADGASIYVFSTDPALIDVVQQAGGEQYPIHGVSEWADLADLVERGRCRIVLLDAETLGSQLQRRVVELSRHAAPLVVLVAAPRDVAQKLIGLLSDRSIHRLLIKPAAPGITRLLLESAVSRYLQLREAPPEMAFERPSRPEEVPAGTRWPAWLLATALVSLLIGGAIVMGLSRLSTPVPWLDALLHRQAPPVTAPTAGASTNVKTPAGATQPAPTGASQGAPGAAASTVGPPAASTAPPNPYRAQLDKAAAALDQGHIAAPAGDNALDDYAAILAKAPDQPEAQRQMNRALEIMYGRVQDGLLAGKLDAAANALDAIRRVRPDSKRLEFLDAQLARARKDAAAQKAAQARAAKQKAAEQKMAAQKAAEEKAAGEAKSGAGAQSAPNAAASGGPQTGGARVAVTQSAGASTPTAQIAGAQISSNQNAGGTPKAASAPSAATQPPPAASPQSAAAQSPAPAATVAAGNATSVPAAGTQPATGAPVTALSTDLADTLSLARMRLQQKELLQPAGDSARDYLQRAVSLNPDDPRVLKLREDLAAAVAAQARIVLGQGDLDQADALVREAFTLGANQETLAGLDIDLDAARAAAVQKQRATMLANGQARLQGGQWIQPDKDSALYYLSTLRTQAPKFPGLDAAWAKLLDGLAANADKALGNSNWSEAQQWIDALAGVDAGSARVKSLRNRLVVGRRQQRYLSTSVPVGALQVVETGPLQYPHIAESNGIQGYVVVEFIVAKDGTTRDARVVEAQPKGWFENAALQSIAKYRFMPFSQDGHVYDRLVRARLQFNLK